MNARCGFWARGFQFLFSLIGDHVTYKRDREGACYREALIGPCLIGYGIEPRSIWVGVTVDCPGKTSNSHALVVLVLLLYFVFEGSYSPW